MRTAFLFLKPGEKRGRIDLFYQYYLRSLAAAVRQQRLLRYLCESVLIGHFNCVIMYEVWILSLILGQLDPTVPTICLLSRTPRRREKGV